MKRIVLFSCALAAVAQASVAAADGVTVEAQVRAFHRRAMEERFLRGDAGGARELLDRGLATCQGGCTAGLLGLLHRDRAVVLATSGADRRAVHRELTLALLADPELALEPHRRSSLLDDAYVAARRDAGLSVASQQACPAGAPCARTSPPGSSDPTADGAITGAPRAGRCATARDCGDGECQAGACVPPRPAPRRWIGLEVSGDIVFLSSTRDVCLLDASSGLPVNDGGYYCTVEGSNDYPARGTRAGRDVVAPGQLDAIAGGPSLGSFRVSITFDIALLPPLLVGLRLGYAAGTYGGRAARTDGKALAPVHAEVRATVLFNKARLLGLTAWQYAYVAGGYGRFDSGVDVEVYEPAPDLIRTARAWSIGGPLFARLGLGIRYMASTSVAVSAGPHLTLAFGNGELVPVIGPEVATSIGF